MGLGEGLAGALGLVLDRALAGMLIAGGLAEGLVTAPVLGLFLGLVMGLPLGLGLALVSGLLQTRFELITSRTPNEAHSRSLIAALTWMVGGLIGELVMGLAFGLAFGLVVGLGLALRNGGWFVLLQKVAHRRLAQDGNFPPHPYDFLKWGIDRQIFRRVGGGVRFRHNLIQQHLANTSEGVS